MTLDDAYRILEVSPSANAEEVKAAHRDLTKVWHPDRFATDATMQRRAEEKLKAINEAYEVIRSRGSSRRRPSAAEAPSSPPTVRERLRRLMTWMMTCVLLGLFILVRRPTLGGLVIAGVLFAAAGVMILKMRALER